MQTHSFERKDVLVHSYVATILANVMCAPAGHCTVSQILESPQPSFWIPIDYGTTFTFYYSNCQKLSFIITSYH